MRAFVTYDRSGRVTALASYAADAPPVTFAPDAGQRGKDIELPAEFTATTHATEEQHLEALASLRIDAD
ncbi:hypothetical protein I5Q34_32240 [Streptomyces sp. AV19]|uniref:hypothetical protein n=1 Tax=Streptomyces sp. AV19 TaxID=2793068 RepID=UPI0018FEB48D|nr:hypothetical protein [Streptomyces sp. AV19]MBH1938877.1 hypothetical protein [Streptomyces sp. AV19]MDG4533504.1 hypothetical protein [Streptomyces sp. AV19]